MQQQVSHLHHLATRMGQPLPQVILNTERRFETCVFIISTYIKIYIVTGLYIVRFKPVYIYSYCFSLNRWIYICRKLCMQQGLTPYHRNFSSWPPSRDQAQQSRKMRSVCKDGKKKTVMERFDGLPWAAALQGYYISLPVEETIVLEAGAGGREDVQEGMKGGGWVTQVQDEIYKLLQQREKDLVITLQWCHLCIQSVLLRFKCVNTKHKLLLLGLPG